MENPRMLVVEPTYFDVKHIDNNFQNLNVRPDLEKGWDDWEGFVETCRSRGACIDRLPGTPGLEDQVFVANVGVADKNRFVKSRFRNEHRQPEADIAEQYFRSLGYQIYTLPDGIHFEGTGDLIPIRDGLFLGGYGHGYPFRTDPEAFPLIERFLDSEVVTFELQDRDLYHTDTAVARIRDNTALYHVGSITPPDLDRIRRRIPNLFPVSTEDARQLLLNGVAIGDSYIVGEGNPTPTRQESLAQLRNTGIEVIERPFSEFAKAGGGPFCARLFQ